MPHPSLPPWFNRPYIWRRAGLQMVKLSIMWFSPGSVTSPTYVQNSPQHSVLIFLVGTWHFENTINIIPYQI
jgi:hypothetical protein